MAMEDELDPMLEPNDTLAEALTDEKNTLLELKLAQDEERPKAESVPSKKKLKREMSREALARMEDAARTKSDFDKVIEMWNKLTQNEIRRVSNHEILRGDIPLEWDMAEDGITFPRPDSAAVRQAQRGDFLDVIYDCPFEMHELVEDPDISKLIFQMKDDHKEILYYQAIRRYSCARIAAMRGQTDRNIRKARAVLLKKLREELRKCMERREKHGRPLTAAQRKLLMNSGELSLDHDKRGW